MEISEKNIFFLEVEKGDEKNVLSTFPSARIISKILSEKEIIQKCQEAEILCISLYSKISSKVIESLPNLKMIVTRTVGYDQIDLKKTKERNILVANVPDYGSHVIAEHVFALLLSSIRRVLEGEERTENSEFNFKGLRGIALKGKTLGIIGTGKIGLNVARIASLGFLMDVIAYDVNINKDTALENHFKYVNLDKLYHDSDIITLHCPLLPSTKHMINTKAIKKMKDGVIIVNTARGGVIDTKALISGIKSGKIHRAALDVLEHEKNIEKNGEILNLKNVIITPHIAFYADASLEKMYSEAIKEIQHYLKTGELIHQVKGI